MHSLPFALALGCLATATLPWLPPPAVPVFLLLFCLLLRPWRYHRSIPLCAVLLGLIWGIVWGTWQMYHRLPLELDRGDFLVTGIVTAPPRIDERRARFRLRVEHLRGLDGSPTPPLQLLRLSWYGDVRPRAGERWRLVVRLRHPRNFANPGGFDYSGWLLSNGISATGYVRDDARNSRRAVAAGGLLPQLRQGLLDRIGALSVEPAVQGLMAALVVGESGRIPPDLFDRLVTTGTVHLVVVSGLHVGMVAALGFLPGLLLGRLGAALGSPVPAPVVGSGAGLATALAYGALAGLDLPVQRALMMTAAGLAAVWLRRRVSLTVIFGWALAGVALLDPLAATRSGFWLSFTAVAALLLWFAPRPPLAPGWRLAVAQAAVFTALAAPLLFFQGTVFPSALVVNLVAIPWVSLGIVPLCLGGALLQGWPLAGDGLWRAAAFQLGLIADMLESSGWLAAGRWQPPGAGDPGFVVVVGLTALLLLAPPGLGLRRLAPVLVGGLVLARPQAPPALAVTALEVGQGLAVVVRVGERTLVYDSGARFSPRFDAGTAIVAPFLRRRGVDRIEHLIVSHGDNDHAGGVPGLVKYYPPARIFSGEWSLPVETETVPCARGRGWHWEGVKFRFLWPPAGVSGRDNDISCVLAIDAGFARILLPGDIESGVERRLVANGVLEGPPRDLVVAPHHGSRTSSTKRFVAATRPRHVVFSAGFNHHFGHPHEEVVARYRRAGSQLWSTAYSGAVSFRWDGQGRLAVRSHRDELRRFWWDSPAGKRDGEFPQLW